MVLRQVDKIRRIKKEYIVYNFSCQPSETYYANGILVHNCSCEDRDKSAELDIKKIKRFFDKYDSIQSVTISGGGEPLIYKQFEELIDYFYNKNIKIGMATNGYLIDKYDPEIFKKFTWIRISLSEISDEVLINIISNYIDNINIDWAFSFVSSDCLANNIQTLELFYKRFKDRITHFRVVGDILNPDDRVNKIQEFFESKKDYNKFIFQARQNFVRGLDKCYLPLLKPVLAADGNIYACCIHEDESVLIQTDNGIINKRIKDVCVGDYAYNNGKIIKKWDKEVNEYLLITLKNGSFIKASKDHLFIKAINLKIKAKIKKIFKIFDKENIKADSLKVGDLLPVLYNYSKENKSNRIFDLCENDDLLWILGKYISEGWTVLGEEKKSNFYFSFGKHENNYINHLKIMLNKYKIKYKVYVRRTTAQFCCYDLNFRKILLQCGSKALNKKIPEFIFKLNKEDKLKFIKSYYEGDGNLQKPSLKRIGYSIGFSTISPILANDLIVLLKTLNIHAALRKEKRDKMIIENRIVNCHDIYRIKISGKYNFSKMPFFDDNIKDVSIDKRSPKRTLGYLKNENILLIPIKEIELIKEKVKMYDIEVEKTNEFYSSFGILLHNCGSQYAILGGNKDCSKLLSLGNIDDEEIILNRNYFDTRGVCYKCYYSAYNSFIDMFFQDKIKHEEFI